MNLGLVVEMMRYNAWANRTLLDACRELTDEQLDARLPVTSGSTRELLIHIVGGQQTYALRTKGRQAVQRIARWLLTEQRFERMVLRAAAGNTASQRVAEKAGFTREGVAPNAGFTNTGRVDLVVFSLIPADVETVETNEAAP